MRTPSLALLAVAWCLPDSSRAQEPGELFERVVETLEQRYWDRSFRRDVLPGIASRFRPAAQAAESLAEECAVVDGLLARVPSSHLALCSKRAVRGMFGELAGRAQWTLGVQLRQRASRFFACSVLDGGPAARAGVLRGDRVVSIDGVPPARSARLGRRTDDAHLPDAPLHALLVDDDGPERVRLVLERAAGGERREVVVESARHGALQAAKDGARVIVRDGVRIGYVHLWYVHAGCVRLLRELVSGAFADCDALVLDLRGRGGNAAEAQGIVGFFAGRRPGWDRPLVALIDRGSRSAKEMIAYELGKRGAALLVGERTAGALVPAFFQDVGQEMVLMYPGVRIPKYSDAVELVGVAPDVPVAYPLPYTAGADPVLERAVWHLAGPEATTPRASGRRPRPR